MKKYFTLAAALLSLSTLVAQDLTSKKGEPILPEAEDWGIAIDANPFLYYAGNFFGKTSNTNPSWTFFTNNQTITGKYFMEAQMAFRGTVRIGVSSDTKRAKVIDIRALNSTTAPTYPELQATTENTWNRSVTTVGLAGGIEKRKGKTRLQGFYGGEIGFLYSSTKDKFTYGNALQAVPGNTVPVSPSDDFAGASNTAPTVAVQGTLIGPGRVLERNLGSVFSFGMRGFIGAEYFILPKMSLGGEFGWGIGLSTTGAASTKWEVLGRSNASSTATAEKVTIAGSRQNNIALDTDGKNSLWGPIASLRLALHF
jgi:hypothetical protein